MSPHLLVTLFGAMKMKCACRILVADTLNAHREHCKWEAHKAWRKAQGQG